MITKRTNSLRALVISTVLTIALIGCSNDTETPASSASNENETENNEASNNSEANDSQDSESEYPIVIEHALGETVIESKPERVATVQWGNHDVVLAMGVVPVGFSAANFGVQDDSGLLPWTAEKLDELGESDPNVYQDTDGLDFEAISDSNPDVILAAYSGITQEDYDLLSEIAPVVAYPTSPWTTSWRDQITLSAEGMGMKAEGEQLIEDIENLIDEKLADYPEIEGKKVAWVNFSANDLSSLHLYTPTDTRVAFLTNELGFEFPENILDLLENDSDYSLNLSAENADVLDEVDIIIGYGDEDLYEALKADSRLGQISAIEKGSVAFINGSSTLGAAGTPNPLSVSYTIDEYLELIGEALSKLDE